MSEASHTVVGVVGLGYVGLPLAVALAERYRVIGYDRSAQRIARLQAGHDHTGEVTADELRAAATRLELSADPEVLREASVVIVAVPTPVTAARQPDFQPLISACEAIGPRLRPGATVVFESTVYPGATEEICVPVLERCSGLRWAGRCAAAGAPPASGSFHVGYSPERINPGDREHTFKKITKVVAGDTPETTRQLAALYGAVVQAGIFEAASIKVAEAAKVLENTQRDLNIALMNELAIICHQVGIDTADVLAAARTKWNFLPFTPGLVGGHCIGVDPYYLTHKAEMLGYHPQVILAGRRINDGMAQYLAAQIVKQMALQGQPIRGSRALVLGLTFKEDCPDLRNTRVADVIAELRDYGIEVQVHDPVADPAEARQEYGLELLPWEALTPAAVLLLAVPHRPLLARPVADYRAKAVPNALFVDVKSRMDSAALRAAGLTLWRL